MFKKEYELLVPFVKEPWKSRTFKEVKMLCKKTSESYVYNTLKSFVKEELLVESKVGNSITYSANISETKAQRYFGMIAEHLSWKKNLPFANIRRVIAKIPTSFYTLIITGSYAKGGQKETSDVDMVLIVDDSTETKKIYAQLRFTCEMGIPEIHLYVFKKSEFLQMLINDEANYGKEIAKNNLILHGAGEYYSILGGAIKNGFNDKKLS